MTDDAIRGMRRSYAADISVIDQAVGDMVGALARTGVLDNTWIIYTSDHGEMAGTHGLLSKCVLYEPAVRVPLIVRPPGDAHHAVVDSLVEHLDVPATVREIAGAPELARTVRGARSWPVSTARPPRPHATGRSARTGVSPPSNRALQAGRRRGALEPCQPSTCPRIPQRTTISSPTPYRVPSWTR